MEHDRWCGCLWCEWAWSDLLAGTAERLAVEAQVYVDRQAACTATFRASARPVTTRDPQRMAGVLGAGHPWLVDTG